MRDRLLLLSLLCSVFMFFVGVAPAHAQTGEVSGTVTDGSSGTSLPGVNIVVIGTQQGASTDAEGQYTISGIEPGTYDLRATFVGYQEQVRQDVTVSAGETTQVDFTLSPQSEQLDEVVVVGYGTQREADVTSSISSVDSGEFLEGAARDAGELLEDQVAGLNISQPSGDPRSGSSISLRGTTTILASSEPLVLIDGVPGNLDTVAPQDIESVDVLKGGSAAAIYGSRASNGVILISTRTQGQDEPTRISYNTNLSYESINNQPDFLSASELRNLKSQYESQYPGLPISSMPIYENTTDWQSQVLRNPITQVHNLAFSGGDASTNYRASLNYENREGIIKRSNNDELVGRIRVGHTMLEGALQADLTLTGRTENSWNGFDANIWRQAMTRNPTDRVRNEEGDWQERPADNYANPLGLINEDNGEAENREIRLNGTVTWSPIDDLSLSLLGANNRFSTLSEGSTTFDHVNTTKAGLDGTAFRDTYSNEETLLEFTGTYQNEIQDHDVKLLGGYSWQENVTDQSFAYNEDFPTDAFESFNMGTGQALPDGEANMTSSYSAWKLIGFFGRVNYNYDNRYLLMASLRYEGNSKFGQDNKWGYFPGASVGWRIAQEDFMSDVGFVDALKLRAGFGVTGIAPTDPYQSLASFTYGGSFFNDGEWVQGLEPARNPNPNLRWERKTEINLGLDFTLLDQRLSGNVDVYRRNTEDLLFDYSVPVPPFLFDTITANVGEMENEGIETRLQYDVIDGEKWSWRTTVNASTNQNELVSLSNDEFQTENPYFDTGYLGGPIQQATHRIKVGGPVGNFWGFKSVGVNEDGIWMIETPDGTVKPWTEKTFEDKQVIGNGVPDYRASWSNSIRYGNFDARVTMGGEFGHQILNVTNVFYQTPGNNAQNWLESAFNEVDGQIVRNREAYVSHMIEDGDYWKIESVTLGYRFDSLIDGISNARFYVTGRNLATFTGYSGIDPEVDTAGLTPGVDDRFKYPTTRAYTVGLNLTF